jgi:hypothetical protein
MKYDFFVLYIGWELIYMFHCDDNLHSTCSFNRIQTGYYYLKSEKLTTIKLTVHFFSFAL